MTIGTHNSLLRSPAQGVAMMYISWTYKYVPLLVLNPNLFYPFGPIISFPTGIEGKLNDECYGYCTMAIGFPVGILFGIKLKLHLVSTRYHPVTRASKCYDSHNQIAFQVDKKSHFIYKISSYKNNKQL